MKPKIMMLAPMVGLCILASTSRIQAQPDPEALTGPPVAVSPATSGLAAPVDRTIRPGPIPGASNPDGFAIGTTGQNRVTAFAAASAQGVAAPNIDGVRPEDASAPLRLNEGAPRVSDRVQYPQAPFRTNGWFIDQSGNRIPIDGSDPTVRAPPFVNPGPLKVTNQGIIPPRPKTPPGIGTPEPSPPGKRPRHITWPTPYPPRKQPVEIRGTGGTVEVDPKDPDESPDQISADPDPSDPNIHITWEPEPPIDGPGDPVETDATEPEEPTTVAAEANFVVLDMTAPNLSLLVREPFSALESSVSIEEEPVDAEPGQKTHELSHQGPHFFEMIARGELPDPDRDRIFPMLVAEEPFELTEERIREVDIPTSAVRAHGGPLYLAVNVPYEFRVDLSDNFDDETNTLTSVVRLETSDERSVQFELDPDGISGTVKFLASNYEPVPGPDVLHGTGDVSDPGNPVRAGAPDLTDASDDPGVASVSSERLSLPVPTPIDVTTDGITHAFRLEARDRRGNRLILTVPVWVYQRGLEVKALGGAE